MLLFLTDATGRFKVTEKIGELYNLQRTILSDNRTKKDILYMAFTACTGRGYFFIDRILEILKHNRN